MDNVIIFEDDDLEALSIMLDSLINSRTQVYRVRVCVDDGGLKIKINEYIWSPPLGKREVR